MTASPFAAVSMILFGLRAVPAGCSASDLPNARALSVKPMLGSCRQHCFYLY